MTQLLLDIIPESTPTLENFVTGRNIELLNTLVQYLDHPGQERCIYLWGESGCGKSHLLQALVALARNAGLAAIYQCGAVADAASVVAIDDVDMLDNTSQIALFELFNIMRDSGRLLLVSGSGAPANMQLRDDLRTRLSWGLVFKVHSLNDEEKAQALENHAIARGIAMPEDVTQYLLRHGRRDLPSLIAILDALDKHCLRQQRTVSIPMLKEVLEPGFSQ